MHAWIGTSGYSYREWIGRFYPESFPAAKMLGYYGERLNAVEINSTFYRVPSAATFGNWGRQVHDRFRFAVKAPRQITHERRLIGVQVELSSLLSACRSLGGLLGPILFQLPPHFRQDLALLDAFLKMMAPDMTGVMEFRHPSWHRQDTYDCLKEYNFALCIVDGDEGAGACEATADFGYVRLRKSGYTEKELVDWVQRIWEKGWREVYCFFRHDEGEAPVYAQKLLSLLRSYPGVG